MEKEKILLIDDDLNVCQSIQSRMRNDQIEVICTTSPKEILENGVVLPHCLVIMDTCLAKTDGMNLLQMIRNSINSPILVLERELSSKRRVALFQAGADACLEKPFDLDVCVAQALSLIRLYKGSKGRCRPITFGAELIISRCHRQVLVEGKFLQLTRKEFDLLYCFASSPGQVFSREQLYAHVWDEVCPIGGDETVKVHIKTLRKKLDSVGKRYIQNVWGIGYKFVLNGS